ncbi:unnamed protein product [Bathycoccus prasinos]
MFATYSSHAGRLLLRRLSIDGGVGTRSYNSSASSRNSLWWRCLHSSSSSFQLRRAFSGAASPNDGTGMKKTKEKTKEEETRLISKEEDEHYMRMALAEAEKAFAGGEVPVGAVLVHKISSSSNKEKDQQQQFVLARSHNTSETKNNPLAHAELECIESGRKALGGDWRRLKDSTLYVTLEPCAMCAGAILQARVGNVVYGARNPQLGAHGSWCGLLGTRDGEESKVAVLRTHAIMPEVTVRSDVLAEECSELMKTFFKNRREQAREEKERLKLEEEKYRELLFTYDGVRESEKKEEKM